LIRCSFCAERRAAGAALQQRRHEEGASSRCRACVGVKGFFMLAALIALGIAAAFASLAFELE
jgi:hypothetical protein